MANMTRHGRRPIRSALVGPLLPNPHGRAETFRTHATAVTQFLMHRFRDELAGVNIGFASMPQHISTDAENNFYTVDQRARTILLYRIPIQRFKGLHVEDAEHRRLFLEHTVYRAVCDYLEVPPWELLPGYFEHY